MLNRCSSAPAPVRERNSWLSNPLLGAASNSQATAPRNGGVTNEAVTSARMVCRPGMSVRDTSQPIGAATVQQIAADVVAMIAVVSKGSRKSGSVNSLTKFCSVGFRALSVKAYTASHDIGITISTIMTAANSHSTGLVQSILALMGAVSVMAVISTRIPISPHPEERRLRRVSKDEGPIVA